MQHVVGCHDFRNLCKMDVANGVVQYDRRILSASVRVVARDPFHNDTDTASGLLLLIFFISILYSKASSVRARREHLTAMLLTVQVLHGADYVPLKHWNHSPSDTVSHVTRLESSSVWGGQMFNNKYNAHSLCSYYTCGVVVHDVAMGQLLSEYCSFPLSV